MQLLLQKLDELPVITITDCYNLSLFCGRYKLPISDWITGKEIAVKSDFLWAVGKKLGTYFIAITLGVEVISQENSTQIKRKKSRVKNFPEKLLNLIAVLATSNTSVADKLGQEFVG